MSDPEAFVFMAALMRELNALGRKLGFALDDDVETKIGFYRDKPTRPSILKDFELGREPELASNVLVFNALASALGMVAPKVSS